MLDLDTINSLEARGKITPESAEDLRKRNSIAAGPLDHLSQNYTPNNPIQAQSVAPEAIQTMGPPDPFKATPAPVQPQPPTDELSRPNAAAIYEPQVIKGGNPNFLNSYPDASKSGNPNFLNSYPDASKSEPAPKAEPAPISKEDVVLNKKPEPSAKPKPQGVGSGGRTDTSDLDPMKISKKYQLATEGTYLDKLKTTKEQELVEKDQKEKEYQLMLQGNREVASSDRIDEVYRKHDFKTAQYNLDNLNKQANDLANMKIDPNHFWTSRSVPERILAAISMALGSFAASTRGGQNDAMSIINHSIDRDIDAQKANFESKKASFSAKQSIFADQMKLYKDAESARLASRVILLDQTKRKLEENAAASGASVVKINAAKALTQLKDQQNQASYQFGMQQYGILQAQRAAQAAAQQAAQQKAAMVEAEHVTSYTDPKTGKQRLISLPNEAALKNAEEVKTHMPILKQSLDELEKNQKLLGSKAWVISNPVDAARLMKKSEQAHADLQAAITKVYSGRFNLKEAELITENTKPTYFDMFDRVQPAFDQAKQNIAAIEQQILSGARPVIAMPKEEKSKGGKSTFKNQYYYDPQPTAGEPTSGINLTPTALPR